MTPEGSAGRGAAWGGPLEPDAVVVDVTGDDHDLAAAAVAHDGAVLRFTPDTGSDLARALGLRAGHAGTDIVVGCDLLDLGHGLVAVNMVVLGVAPDRLRPWHRARSVTVTVDDRVVVSSVPATTVVVAVGQFLRGADVVPRGHPGDGRIEVQVYSLAAGERGGMRRRLARGEHLPHPRIAQATGRRIGVRWESAEVPLELDGHPAGTAGEMVAEVRPGAVRVLL